MDMCRGTDESNLTQPRRGAPLLHARHRTASTHHWTCLDLDLGPTTHTHTQTPQNSSIYITNTTVS